MNVNDVIEAVLAECGVTTRLEKTCDVLISGTADTEVHGIIVTFMATIDVIKQAIACGANMIITHEPTWYTGLDDTDWLHDDPLYVAKQRLIEENQITIWRFHDHMHLGKTDRIYDGVLREIGWEDNLLEKHPPHTYQIEETTLAELAAFFKQKLSMDVIRIIGNPDIKCKRIGMLVGGGSLGLGKEQMPMELMWDKDLDVMVCGEITEWTLCAYVNDAAMLGLNKGMIIVGHERSEESGMKFMAEWLKPLVNDIPVSFIDAREPFIYL
ncbi:Nif3-like dinuclear metal center hexameric protein [Alicyclobacillus dauci]|uniref:GTP cyclohydrolase 1 type 2 homolog n=1 Tax=Alicyclobacillus dauci TaxID=1475485 RepID=A0ABY6Z2D9_9BACL|nr:Nif3-like dinuclear metal center hexameric protein [Alicyclobacillus dauci]WAH37062.1 Nif3-like dinuclear metal center hexameric protein [Alicyclobacillus dauci]